MIPEPLMVEIWREGAFVRRLAVAFTEYVETPDGVIARHEMADQVDAFDEVRIDVLPPKTSLSVPRQTFIEDKGLLEWNSIRTNPEDTPR